eukprot:Colp12_sorted_trinity150504_noHs@13772
MAVADMELRSRQGSTADNGFSRVDDQSNSEPSDYSPRRHSIDSSLLPPEQAHTVEYFQQSLEKIRILMKMHSYIRESYRAVSAVKENERWTFSQLFFAVPHFQHYIYFLFVPTLIFRQSYPRSSTI